MKKLGVYVALFFFIYGVVFFGLSFSLKYKSEFGPGPGFLPTWTNCLLIICSVLYLISAFKKDLTFIQDVIPKGEGFINVLVTIASLILFMVIVPFAGFVVSSIITLFLLFSRGYRWYLGLGMATTVTFIVFWVFGSLFGIPLPVNEYGW
ncbi:putative tricarboxylic transport membrane protein [Neobacillus niacini]|uniref:tripartite tricarboxylate transporter TctB family protein n=1 Tax=Neobacillus niacini TaxID=86668 RepID=UPI002788D416|nr:tripartite tricarboxylate transporter TctB family protein [Neobacillus niacini]MDQ1002035.1 putative tricarboxylic transport membrane protein [Neobacillus niacini]